MISLSDAQNLDSGDPLAHLRGAFCLPAGDVYLNGNSLGLLSAPAEAAIGAMIDQWKAKAGGAWMDPADAWFDYTERVSARLAAFVGAERGEVIATGSTTSNLHQLLATFYQPTPARPAILIDSLAFPSDAHAVQSHLRLHRLEPETHLRKVASRDGATIDEAAIEAMLQAPGVSMAILPAVVYGSGQLIDMPRITRAAKQAGVMLGWDCSHAIGAVPLNFGKLDCDFAFWCHYKYMNAGPGAVAGMYVNQRHLTANPGLAGWFGMDKSRQFLMQHTFEPAAGAGRFQVGSPHLLSLAALRGSLSLFDRSDIASLRSKSLALTEFLFRLIDERLAKHGAQIVTPREPHRRGGHVSIAHENAEQICKAIAAEGIVTDFRRPGIIRITPAAMYSTFEECFRAVEAIDVALQK
ncbi:MAG TPA: kynureninase [Tepidisphaeraceae bacterium]|nr:kynureninase [Tepidisphaeraceae bacterium]